MKLTGIRPSKGSSDPSNSPAHGAVGVFTVPQAFPGGTFRSDLPTHPSKGISGPTVYGKLFQALYLPTRSSDVEIFYSSAPLICPDYLSLFLCKHCPSIIMKFTPWQDLCFICGFNYKDHSICMYYLSLSAFCGCNELPHNVEHTCI